MKPAMKYIEQSELKRKSTTEAYFSSPPAVVCLLFLTAGIAGTEAGSGGAARSSRGQKLDEELQATGCTPPTSQPGNQILPLFPAAHRMGTSAAENLIRYAESERNVKRLHVKTECRRTRLTSRIICSVITLCYLVRQPSVTRRTTNNNGGSPSCGRACDELIKASLSKCTFVAVRLCARPHHCCVVCLYSGLCCRMPCVQERSVCLCSGSYGLSLCSWLAAWRPVYSSAHVNARTHEKRPFSQLLFLASNVLIVA